MRHLFSILGLALGIIAVGIAAFENQLSAPAKNERTLSQVASEAGKRILKEKILKEKTPTPEQTEALHPVRVTYTALGLAAAILGILSWIRGEHKRMAGAAVALGIVAVCWQWFLIGVAIAAVLIILSNLG